MKNALRLACVLALSAWSAACIGVDVLVKVKGDGSGTVEKSLTMNPAALADMAQSMKGSGKVESKTKDPSKLTDEELLSGPFDPEELKKEAARMGEGATFVSEGSLEQQKAALSKVKGMKVHLEPEMVVEFKPN